MPDKHIDAASVSVNFAKITPIKPVNPELTLCTVYVQGVGKNRNFSYMSEENIKACLPTLDYIPVVGHLLPDYDKDGEVTGYHFGSHDYVLNDDLTVTAMTVPFGVVMSDTACFEDVEEYGKTVRYLKCNAILWTGRFPELKDAAYDESTWFNQSMEIRDITWRPLEEDSNYTEFLKWRYSALCILGKSDDPELNSEPCYLNSRIDPVNFDLATAQFSQLMGELQSQLALCFEQNQTHQKGGNTLTQKERDEIFAQFDLAVDAVDFEIAEDMTADQLKEKLEAFAAAHPAEEPKADEPDHSGEAADFEHTDEIVAFSKTYNEKYDALSQLCRSMNYTKDDGEKMTEELCCYLRDFDDTYAFYSASLWTPGDYVQKWFRRGYTFDASGNAGFVGEPEEIFQKWLTAAEIQKLDDDKMQLEILTQFKLDADKANHEAKRDGLFEEFADLAKTEEFTALHDEVIAAENYDLEMLELKLYALRGKLNASFARNTNANSGLRVGIDPDDKPTDDGYGGLVERVRSRKH